MNTSMIAAALWASTAVAPVLEQHHVQSQSYVQLQRQRPDDTNRSDPSTHRKPLSEEELTGVKRADGMSIVIPAEYNDYPGPILVLQLKDALDLTAQQHAEIQMLSDELQACAMELSDELIRSEQVLDELFAQEQTAPATMAAAVAAVIKAQSQMRDTHLQYRIAIIQILTPRQLAIFRKIRGY